LLLIAKIQGKRFILILFHDFPLAWLLVVDAAEMQDAVDDDTMELALEGLSELLCIGAHRFESDDDVTGNFVAFGIIEGDDVGIKVMLQVLPVAGQDAFIIDKLVAYRAQTLAMKLGDLANPRADVTPANGRHGDALAEK